MIKDSFTLFRELLSNPTLGPTLEDFYNKALEAGRFHVQNGKIYI